MSGSKSGLGGLGGLSGAEGVDLPLARLGGRRLLLLLRLATLKTGIDGVAAELAPDFPYAVFLEGQFAVVIGLNFHGLVVFVSDVSGDGFFHALDNDFIGPGAQGEDEGQEEGEAHTAVRS